MLGAVKGVSTAAIRKPLFIDAHGTPCAVASLMQQTAHASLASRVSRALGAPSWWTSSSEALGLARRSQASAAERERKRERAAAERELLVVFHRLVR